MDKQDQFEDLLAKVLKGSISDHTSPLYQACEYALFPGGKRLRPNLALAFSPFCQNEQKQKELMYHACALELFHTSSLVHDDMPCIDDDDIRRGKLSVHKKFSDSTALLVGLSLNSIGFEVLSQHILNPKTCKSLVYESAKRIGNLGLVAGQIEDVRSISEKMSASEFENLFINKTSSLMRLAMVGSALILNREEIDIQEVDSIGKSLGVLFQCGDDLEEYQHEKRLSPLIQQHGISALMALAQKHLNQIHSSLKNTTIPSSVLTIIDKISKPFQKTDCLI